MEELLEQLKSLQEEYYAAHQVARSREDYIYTEGQVNAISRAITIVTNTLQ